MKLERILSELRQIFQTVVIAVVLVHCLLCLSFSKSTQQQQQCRLAHFDPFRFASPLPHPNPPQSDDTTRSKASSELRECRLCAAPSIALRAEQSLSVPSSQSAWQAGRQPVGLSSMQSSSRLVEFQTVLHAVWICSWRVAPSSRANSQSNKGSMISDSTLARKFATSSSILTTKEKSRRELLSQKPPFCSSCCWQLLCAMYSSYCLGCRKTMK